ncbi:MAG: tetratricopeptide repeat protein [Okeania sp. SIO3I5]|nr:tetratricopeptide repeat protein [Okeania sp. SIO3I5]
MEQVQTLRKTYTVIQDLKKGPFGKTYLAENQQAVNKSLCIVKQFQPSTSDPSILEAARCRFEKEVTSLKQLGNHEQIPQILDHFEEDQKFYLVYEFIEGHDLGMEITDGKQVSQSQLIMLLYDTLEALEYIHRQDVIHRDIKPSNLIRRKSDNKIVITDFGAIKEIETLVLSSEGEVQASVLGTPGYMSVEHLGGKPKINSDIYALGITAIQALTGVAPIDLLRHSKTNEILWRELAAVEDELADILDKMVCNQYEERYQSATEVLNDLEELYKNIQTSQRIGTILNKHYKIIRLLGEGDYGQTYLVQDQQKLDNSLCVIKQIKPKSKNPLLLQEVKKLFEEEAQIIYNQGVHDQIPAILDEFQENQEFYLVQEYVEGNSLNYEIDRGKFTESEAKKLLEDVLQILTFVHRQVLHLDIKPSNLIRRSDGKIILIDFGSLKQLSSVNLNEQKQLIITRFVGTHGYMPKEQYTRNPNPSNDLYALGMTVVHALTGLFPAEIGRDPKTGDLGWRHYTEVSNEFAVIINRMVNPYFRARYQSADQVLNDLWNIGSQTEFLIEPESPISVEPEIYNSTEIATENSANLEPDINVQNQEFTETNNENIYPENSAANFTPSPSINYDAKTSVRKKRSFRLLPFSLISFGVMVIVGGIVFWSEIKFIYLLNKCNKWIEVEQPEIAESFCAEAIKIKPNDSNVLKNNGDVLLELQRYQAALVAYTKAIENKQDFDLAWNGRGLALNKLERYQQSLEAYQKAIEISANNFKAWNGKGIALISIGQFEEALKAINQAIAIDPIRPQSWENKGIALEYLKRDLDARKAFEEALALLERQIRDNPEDLAAMVDRGQVLSKLQRHQKALASYEQALELNPDFYRASMGKGNTLFFLQRFEEALDAYKKATASRPKYHIAWHNQGSFLADGLQRYEEAVASYQKAIDIDPSFAPAWRDQGFALMRLGRSQEAIAAFDEAIKLNADDFQSWGSRGIALTKLKRYDEAVTSLDQAIAINSQDPIAWSNLGWALEKMEKYEEAIAALDKAIEIKPDFASAIKARKKLKEKLNNSWY